MYTFTVQRSLHLGSHAISSKHVHVLCSSNAMTEVLTDCTWSVTQVISSDDPECHGDSQTLRCFQKGERSRLVFRSEKSKYGCTHLWAPLTSAIPRCVRAEVPDCPTGTNNPHGCGSTAWGAWEQCSPCYQRNQLADTFNPTLHFTDNLTLSPIMLLA